MKLLCFLLLICFLSCNRQKVFIDETFIDEYVTVIGKNIPDAYTLESGNEYSMRVSNDKDNSETFMNLIVNDNDIVQSCYISLSFSDFVYTKLYYKQLLTRLKNENWQFVENISKYKRPYGEIYLKNGIYLGIYEPPYALPIELSNSIDTIRKDGFYEK